MISRPYRYVEDESAAESEDDFNKEQKPRESGVSSLGVARFTVFDS
jgi:hypothetical protein